MIFSNVISRTFGKFASKEFSSPVQKFINVSYVKLLKLDMSEFHKPSQYSSLNNLFTRELTNKRSFPEDSSKVISPTDSKITAFGAIHQGLALQIKGMSYNISSLLTEHISSDKKGRLEGGEYINFYLSPKDYHHYHMPVDGEILKVIHIPGKLYPVNMPYLRKKPNLFIENERVILEISVQGKTLFMVLVGALNVGKMVLNFEPEVETNIKGETKVFDYTSSPKKIKKGSDLGYFKMGSTAVLLSEKGLFKSKVSMSQKVKFGETIAEMEEN